MAEFCKDCFCEIFGESTVELSSTSDLCEGCGEVKPVVTSVISIDIPLKK